VNDRKSCSTADWIVNIKESMEELKSMAMKGCWKSFGLKQLTPSINSPFDRTRPGTSLCWFVKFQYSQVLKMIINRKFLTLMLLNEKLTVLSTPENEDFGAVMERPQLTSHALKEGLQAADDLFEQFFEVDHFID